ncbi:MAG: mechanosensitive ion channel domain-containing protein [Acidimicrobiales bacterium]
MPPTNSSPNPVKATDLGFNVAEVISFVGPFLARLLVVGVAAAIAMRFTRRAIDQVDDVRNRRQLLFFGPKLVWVVVTLIGLDLSGFDISGAAALLAAVGVTGTVVFTPVGQNYVAGAMTNIDNLYEVGEVVTVGDIFGRVVYQSVLRTELELPDGTKAWIPNSTFQDNEVLNHSRMGGYRIAVDVPLDGTPDRGLAVMVMESALGTLSWNSADKQPYVVFDHVGGEAMFFKVYAWIDDRTTAPYFRGLLLTSLVDALELEGISVGRTTNLSFAEAGTF